MKTTKINLFLNVAFAMLLLSACSEEETETAVMPEATDAVFSYTIDSDEPNTYHFSGTPTQDVWYTHWSFGDGSSAEGLEATKTYFKKGTYNVRFRIFTNGGVADSIQSVTIDTDLADESNLVTDGDFSSDQNWTVFQINAGMDISFANGSATWKGGGGGHAGIYQTIEVEAGTSYQINMDISGSGATDSWFEVYAGASEPVPNNDYTDGGTRMGLNTWNGCGGSAFSDKFANISCSGNGTVQFSAAGTVYLVIRGGGADYGADGISIDNVEMRAL